jgi:NADH-quinone oxidoreductase subunit B
VTGVRWLDWYGDGSMLVVDVGLACCALEFEAAALEVPGGLLPGGLRGGRDAGVTDPAVTPLAEGGQVVVVVSGTVTDRLAPAVMAIVDAAGELGVTPTVVSFGACASSGGPYWDSYAVTKGIDQLVPVDVFVPGCPPPPDALRAVLDRLSGPDRHSGRNRLSGLNQHSGLDGLSGRSPR